MRRPQNEQIPFFLAAAIGGAALAYYLDPAQGRRRRHQTRDRAISLTRRGSRRGRKLFHHASSDVLGLGRRLIHRLPHEQPELDDATLAHKVESILFRDRDVPKGQININAENGVVYLRGEVEQPELMRHLEERTRKVSGVRGVENLLHTPGSSSR
jgi:hypothetical protein